MAIIKCKMCGGDLEIAAGTTVAECEFCGTRQTLPSAGGEIVQNLFNRANALRLKCEFDKAEQIYEKILQEDNSEAEAHWGIVLCKYGIEYVEDPKTYKRIPTCHRTSYDAVTADADYLAAIQYADATQRSIYEAEAKAIDAIQKNILTIVKDEKPFDVFLCYKETDENGKRTVDSAVANDIYHQLTQEGMKVFYAAITLEDKLGQEYEPYIFAALNSARVMLVIGTKPQYFTAVWVKNEWSRFLKLMKTDRSKLLIPCYRDMDAYELPEEFAHLQAQDMSKIGFINDVVRGIRKVIVKDQPAAAAAVTKTVVTESSANIAPLLKRAFMFLEDGDWSSAAEYCEKVLDQDPENVRAYLGKLMAELKVRKQEALRDCPEPFSQSGNYQKVLRFGDEALKAELTDCIEYIKTRNENARLEGLYQNAKQAMEQAATEYAYKGAAVDFSKLGSYKDSAALAEKCKELAENARLEGLYIITKRAMKQAATKQAYKDTAVDFSRLGSYKDSAALAEQCNELAEAAGKNAILADGKRKLDTSSVEQILKAKQLFESIPGWKDADALAQQCQTKIEQLQKEEELQQQRNAKLRKRKKVLGVSLALAAVFVVAFIIIWFSVISPSMQYNEAVELMNAGKYDEAAIAFDKIKYYKDAAQQSKDLWDQVAQRETISTGAYHTVGLKTDGTVVAVGQNSHDQCNVSNWTDIVAISAGGWHTIGLKADGTVVAVGDNSDGQCNVSDWTDIVAISAGRDHTVGLKADGTVVAVGYNSDGQCNVSNWTDIVAISAGGWHTIGLKADGTVVAVGWNSDGQCNVSDWTDIVAISAASVHTVGLKADGTVVAVGNNGYDRCNVSDWTDIVAISAGDNHTVGLKADGTVVAVGDNGHGRCNVSDWTDIVAISAGPYHTVGLKSDGTVVAIGSNVNHQCDVSDWTDTKTALLK